MPWTDVKAFAPPWSRNCCADLKRFSRDRLKPTSTAITWRLVGWTWRAASGARILLFFLMRAFVLSITVNHVNSWKLESITYAALLLNSRFRYWWPRPTQQTNSRMNSQSKNSNVMVETSLLTSELKAAILGSFMVSSWWTVFEEAIVEQFEDDGFCRHPYLCWNESLFNNVE